MVYTRLFHPSSELEISYLIQILLYISIEIKKKYLETLQTDISNSYYEKCKHFCIFKQHSLFNRFIHAFFSAYYKTRQEHQNMNISGFQQ